MFRSLILSACLIGVVLGFTTTAVQQLGVAPIILAAEQYEGAEEPAAADHAHEAAGESEHDHEATAGHHGGETWAPDNGAERIFYSTISNVLAGIGFSAVLLVLMNQLRERGYVRLTPARGILCGAVSYLAIFLLPAFGLPPEVPGAAAAQLESRQVWWLFTAVMAAVGLGLLFLAPNWKKLLGLPLLVVPYFFVPVHEGAMFSNPDPAAVEALENLHHEFIWASGLTNLVFWLLAGLLCAIALKRLTKNQQGSYEQAST